MNLGYFHPTTLCPTGNGEHFIFAGIEPTSRCSINYTMANRAPELASYLTIVVTISGQAPKAERDFLDLVKLGKKLSVRGLPAKFRPGAEFQAEQVAEGETLSHPSCLITKIMASQKLRAIPASEQHWSQLKTWINLNFWMTPKTSN